jgi:prepilin-type N-terminal cleavage/methylation domain-containing protein
MKMLCHSVAAFSLTELLVVMAIIAILAGAGVAALGGGGGRGPQGAAVVASSVFNLARTEAILRSTDTMVVIDITSTSPNFLQRISVYDSSAIPNRIAQWTMLPGMAYFNMDLSKRYGTTNIGGTNYAVYTFKPNGQFDPSTGSDFPKFVVSPGSTLGGTFQEAGTNKRYGFKIHKMGKLTFFSDPSEIE